MDNFIKGLLIFQANGETEMGAIHDMFYAGGSESYKDYPELTKLGWIWDDILESFHYYV